MASDMDSDSDINYVSYVVTQLAYAIKRIIYPRKEFTSVISVVFESLVLISEHEQFSVKVAITISPGYVMKTKILEVPHWQ